jgi:hypothetical protein
MRRAGVSVVHRATKQTYEVPSDLLQAMEGDALTDEQLRRLIALEAAQLGLNFDEAVRRARDGSLPKTVVGSDVELLVDLLPDSA